MYGARCAAAGGTRRRRRRGPNAAGCGARRNRPPPADAAGHIVKRRTRAGRHRVCGRTLYRKPHATQVSPKYGRVYVEVYDRMPPGVCHCVWWEIYSECQLRKCYALLLYALCAKSGKVVCSVISAGDVHYHIPFVFPYHHFTHARPHICPPIIFMSGQLSFGEVGCRLAAFCCSSRRSQVGKITDLWITYIEHPTINRQLTLQTLAADITLRHLHVMYSSIDVTC